MSLNCEISTVGRLGGRREAHHHAKQRTLTTMQYRRAKHKGGYFFTVKQVVDDFLLGFKWVVISTSGTTCTDRYIAPAISAFTTSVWFMQELGQCRSYCREILLLKLCLDSRFLPLVGMIPFVKLTYKRQNRE